MKTLVIALLLLSAAGWYLASHAVGAMHRAHVAAVTTTEIGT